MPTSIAALRGKLGTTQYYIISMKAGELVKIATMPSDLPEWSTMGIEERYQRELNQTRVKNQIAPYLAGDPDRFFGAIIVAVKNFDPTRFHPIAKIGNVPTAWEASVESMGILDFRGGEVFVPLDGQHRLKALKFAIEGHDDDGKKILKVKPLPKLANEDITVILVPHETEKSRRIFTKVNCYAKPTTKGQNLVTDDDNIFAVSARKVANKIITANLVKYKETGQTLSPNDPFFTTLATIAECNEAILKGTFPSDKINPKEKVPDDLKETMYLEKVNEVWEHLTENIKCFSLLLADKSEGGNKKRQEIREAYLLGKPIPQLCLVKVFVKLRNTDNMSLKKASDQLNKIDWRKKNPLWDGLLIGSNGQILYNSAHKNVASDIIYYMCGGKVTPAAEQKLLLQYKNLFPKEMQDKIEINLPPKV